MDRVHSDVFDWGNRGPWPVVREGGRLEVLWLPIFIRELKV